MSALFLIDETPRGGPFGHRFIIPPDTTLLSTEVEAYFQRAALGQGNTFIAVDHQVKQHLANGAVRMGAETLLLTGVKLDNMTDKQVNRIRKALNNLLPGLEELVTKEIDWEEAGQQTLVVRAELADWLRKDIATTLARSIPHTKDRASQTRRLFPKSKRSARLIGSLLALAVGTITLFVWFF